jgi:hypothetical protein
MGRFTVPRGARLSMVAGPMGHGFPHCCFQIDRRSFSAPARCRFEVRRLAVIISGVVPARGSWPISTRRYSRDGQSWFVDCGGSHRAVPQSRAPRPTERGRSISASARNRFAGCWRRTSSATRRHCPCRRSLLRIIRSVGFRSLSRRKPLRNTWPCASQARGLVF